jgi:multidrug resistance efflux pump
VDQQSPTVRWLEHQVSILKNKSASQSVVLSATQNASEAGSFPFHFGYWLPLRYRNAELTYGALIVAERSFEPEQVTVAARLVDTAAHALPVLRMRPPSRATAWKRIALLAALVGSMLALLTPFPMTALAPMEIVASEPFVIAAPIDGVVEEVVVPPNAAVSAGTPIVRYVDAIPRNQMLIAERELGLAEAKVRQVQQAAFTDDRAKRDLAQVRAELALKQSELDLARETFEKAVVRAPRDGVVIYSDRKDWVGRPVTTGQRILEIADPTRVEIRAFLPSVDILDLKPGAKTKVFLDGAPLQPLDAQVVSVSHVAKMVEGFGLAYRVQAVVNSGQPSPRIGVRGTAQLFSEKAPLGYYLFRRPLGWLRQKVGL